jgi:adenylosuccinate synthase
MQEPREGLFCCFQPGADMFDAKTTCMVVVGAQWGDEGKGKLVDVLAERADLVVRYQGGANAGHTVVIGDKQFVLRQIPSGILHPRVTCVIGNGVVLEPENLFSELDHLHERGIDTEGRLFVSDRAHLVMPYHKLLDVASERSQKLGTTGRGIGPAYEDKYGRRGIRVVDLRRLECARALLTERVGRANQLLRMMGSEEGPGLEDHVRLLERLAPRLLPLAADTGLMVHRAIREGRRVLLEGAQGALLDVDHGTYPYVTSSNTTAGGAAVGSGIGPTGINGVLGVVKAYTTRVGNGPLPTQAESPHGDRLRELGGEFGAVTGRPRRCGWFDATVVRYAARVNGLTGLAVTKLDVLDSFAEIPVGTSYRLDGEICEEVPAEVDALGRVQPVYEIHRGWQQPTGGARRLADLPAPARAYLDRLEALSGVPVRYVSVGTRRDQIIEV